MLLSVVISSLPSLQRQLIYMSKIVLFLAEIHEFQSINSLNEFLLPRSNSCCFLTTTRWPKSSGSVAWPLCDSDSSSFLF